jgi:trigger factor
MQINVEATGNLERRMRVEIPEERVQSQVDDRLRSMTRTLRISGFRPGKVPFKVVARQYGNRVREEVVTEMVRTSFQDALAQEDLRLAGNLVIEPFPTKPGEGVTYTAVFEIYPEIHVAAQGFKIIRPVSRITEADVDRMLETLQKQRKRWEVVERPAETGDRVIVDVTGTLNGIEIAGVRGSRVPMEIGSGKLLKSFEERLVGAKAGDVRSLDITYSEDHQDRELAGKTVHFEVTVQAVEAGRLPEINEELARSFGIHEGGIEGFRGEITKNMERELHNVVQASIKQQIMEALLAANPIELPKALVESEIHVLQDLHRKELLSWGVKAEKISLLPPEKYEAQARQRVALQLLVGELIKTHGITADPAAVRAKAESLASTFQEPQRVIQWYYEDESHLLPLESAVLEDEVVNWILAQAEVVDQETSFDELLNTRQTRSR